MSINEQITIPIRYCDLAQLSLLGITIYDMHRPVSESVVASTTIDLFEPTSLLLRQGTFNLHLWPNKPADVTHLGTKTPGVHADNKSLQEVNKLLQKIDRHEKISRFLQGASREPWIDKVSRDAI